MSRFDILKEIVIPPVVKEVVVDKTTRVRWGYAFNESSEIREGYHENTDTSLRLTEKVKKQVEDMIVEWLDGHGVEKDRLQIDLKTEDGECVESLLFQRSEIVWKTCSNNWKIYHIALSDAWPRILSSKPKLLIQKSMGDYVHFKNEIQSINGQINRDALNLLNTEP